MIIGGEAVSFLRSVSLRPSGTKSGRKGGRKNAAGLEDARSLPLLGRSQETGPGINNVRDLAHICRVQGRDSISERHALIINPALCAAGRFDSSTTPYVGGASPVNQSRLITGPALPL